MKAKATGRSQAVAHRALMRDIEADWSRSFRAEHAAALSLQTQLEQAARRERIERLARARQTAAAELGKAKHRAVRRRARIRSTATAAIESARRARRAERAYYRDFRRTEKIQRARGPLRKRPPQTKTEIDSLTENGIPPELVAFWRTVRSRYPYSWPPDRRSEKFAEDMEDELLDELGAFELEHELAADWAGAEAAHYAAQLGAVPF